MSPVRVALAVVLLACGGPPAPAAHEAPPLPLPPTAVASVTPDAGADGHVSPASPLRSALGADVALATWAGARQLATPAGARGLTQLVGTVGRLCALRASGEVACVANGEGWKKVAGVSDATYLSVSHDLACVARRTGAAACFGYVHESWGFHPAPTDLPHVTGATRTANGDATACVLGSDGHVSCMGMGFGGALGRPLERSLEPVEPLGLGEVVDLYGSRFTTCARAKASGVVSCWGVGEHGVLGPFDTTPDGPVEMVGLRGATDLAFEQQWACAVLADGGVACWGDHPAANDDDPRGAYSFQRVYGLHDAVAIALGPFHACALRRTGQVVCFGANNEGQLGDGTTKSRWGATDDTVVPLTPEDVGTGMGTGPVTPRLRKRPPGPRSERLVHVSALNDAVQLANDGFATCALRRTGALVCWGAHLPGTKVDSATVATPVPGPP